MTTKELREVDEFIALNVMGWKRDSDPDFGWEKPDGNLAPSPDLFTTDPAAAMHVLEKCAEESCKSDDTVSVSYCAVKKQWEAGRLQVGIDWQIMYYAEAETLPLAICLFAKKLFSKNQT